MVNLIMHCFLIRSHRLHKQVDVQAAPEDRGEDRRESSSDVRDNQRNTSYQDVHLGKAFPGVSQPGEKVRIYIQVYFQVKKKSTDSLNLYESAKNFVALFLA